MIRPKAVIARVYCTTLDLPSFREGTKINEERSGRGEGGGGVHTCSRADVLGDSIDDLDNRYSAREYVMYV